MGAMSRAEQVQVQPLGKAGARDQSCQPSPPTCLPPKEPPEELRTPGPRRGRAPRAWGSDSQVSTPRWPQAGLRAQLTQATDNLGTRDTSHIFFPP